MISEDKITSGQLGRLTFVSLLAPLIRVLPRQTALAAGSVGFLSVLPAAVFGVLYLLLFSRFFKNAAPGEGLGALIMRSAGPLFGRIIIMFFSIWLIIYSGFIARSAAERLISTVYKTGSAAVFIIVSLTVVLTASCGSVRALARTGQVLAPIIGAVLVFVILASLKQVSPERLFPVYAQDTAPILAGAVPIADVLGVQAWFAIFSGHVSDRSSVKKSSAGVLAAVLLASFGILTVTLGALAPEIAVKSTGAFFTVIRNISVFNVIERVEALIITLWIISDFTLLSSAAMAAGELMCDITGGGSRRVFVMPAVIMIGALAVFMVTDTFTLRLWSDVYIPAGNIAVTLIFIPAVLTVGLVRKKL